MRRFIISTGMISGFLVMLFGSSMLSASNTDRRMLMGFGLFLIGFSIVLLARRAHQAYLDSQLKENMKKISDRYWKLIDKS